MKTEAISTAREPAAAAPNAAPRPRLGAQLSRQEVALLAWALSFALLAVAISLLARSGPVSGVDLLGLGLSVFLLGSGSGACAVIALRLIPKVKVNRVTELGHFEEIFEASPNGIAIWDQHGHLIRANPRYATMLGIENRDILNGAPRSMIEGANGIPLTDIFASKDRALRIGERILFPIRRPLASGEMIETLLDVTALKQREQAIIRYEGEIKSLVKEFAGIRSEAASLQEVIEGLEISLKDERKRADTAMRARTEFLSHMSHELRTPLNAIIGFADMIRSQVFGPLGHDKYEEYAGDIFDSGEQLLRHIADILDVSQMQAGELHLDRQKIDLELIIDAVLDNVRSDLTANQITLLQDINHLPMAFADPMAVRQILTHMLSNAIKHTPPRGRIAIKGESDLNNISIIIDDTGSGISADLRETLDQPFTQVGGDPSITREGAEGLGIGIAVSTSLARINGGCLTIDSEPGYGTTVRLSLPRR